MEGDSDVAILDHLPHGVVERHVVIRMACVVTTENRLAGQIDAAKSELSHAPDFAYCEFNVRSHNSGNGRHEIVVLTKRFPRPIVPYAALCGAELGVLRRPHAEAFVGEDYLSIDPIAPMVLYPFKRICARHVAEFVLAFKMAV